MTGVEDSEAVGEPLSPDGREWRGWRVQAGQKRDLVSSLERLDGREARVGVSRSHTKILRLDCPSGTRIFKRRDKGSVILGCGERPCIFFSYYLSVD